jgi:hypothetical protein
MSKESDLRIRARDDILSLLGLVRKIQQRDGLKDSEVVRQMASVYRRTDALGTYARLVYVAKEVERDERVARAEKIHKPKSDS